MWGYLNLSGSPNIVKNLIFCMSSLIVNNTILNLMIVICSSATSSLAGEDASYKELVTLSSSSPEQHYKELVTLNSR